MTKSLIPFVAIEWISSSLPNRKSHDFQQYMNREGIEVLTGERYTVLFSRAWCIASHDTSIRFVNNIRRSTSMDVVVVVAVKSHPNLLDTS